MNAYTFPPLTSTPSAVSWNSCPPELGSPPILECATFSIPVDWDTQYGEHFDLGLVKLPATPSNTTSKIGSLFINPGGPGLHASGIVASMVLGAFERQTRQLRAWLDIIGLNPRGVGLSHQVNCSKEIYAEAFSLLPQTQENYIALAKKNKRLGRSCRKITGPLFEHVDIISAAKDHEIVRAAL